MPEASRLRDNAYCPSDSHGNPHCCPHSVIGPAVKASEDVYTNQRGALRIGDDGIHAACCGPNTWVAADGSKTVIINGRGAVRKGDRTAHCGGTGNMVEGSDNVIIGG